MGSELLIEEDGYRLALKPTAALGVILDGTTDRPLATEYGTGQMGFQPHYQRITRGDQIYQELIRDSAGPRCSRSSARSMRSGATPTTMIPN
jgi:hypothetical protein